MVQAADGIALTSRSLPLTHFAHQNLSQEAQWWQDSLHFSGNFQRDVAALMAPAGSAIFMLLRETRVPTALEQLRNYGDTIIHTTVSAEQDDKMVTMLASCQEGHS